MTTRKPGRLNGSRSPFGSPLLGRADQDQRTLRIRVQLLITVSLVLANLIGAVVVAVLQTVVIPGPDLDDRTRMVAIIGAPTYVALALVVGWTWGTRRALGVLRWSMERRVPTPARTGARPCACRCASP